MKRIIAIILTTALLLTGCGYPPIYIADDMSVNSKSNAEFYIMKVNNDYLEIPGKCNFIYLDTDGAYPELENGQVARVTADIDVYDGGEAGYTGNYFIKQLHDSVILQYKDVVENVDVPIATETEEMKYERHMLQYQLDDDLYFIVLNRQYIDVYLNEEMFIEYELSSLDNKLSPFFEKVREKTTNQSLHDGDYIVKGDNTIKLLFASQEEYYISQGYIEPHFMIYWIDNDNYAYSAMWKTNDYEPTKAFEMVDSFENIEQLGNTSFADDIDTIIDDISRKELLRHEYEEQDVESYGKWLYGCQYMMSGSPLLIYHVTPDFSEYLNDSQTTSLVNNLYAEPTFQQACESWNEIYEECGNPN